ncbi:MAG: hypothetical protein V7607_2578 [Solirubrobacteraceae bacterium]
MAEGEFDGYRWISLRYPGRCGACGASLQRGLRAQYDPRSRTVTCSACVAGQDLSVPLDPGTAGASANLTYRRRRHAREALARRAFGRVGLGAVGVGLARLTEPRHQRAWQRGARGEEDVARKLQRLLADADVVLLHDRRWPGSRANIDHLAIGPGGVTVIDTKNYSGKVKTEVRGGLLRPRTEHLLIAGRDRTKLVHGVHRQIEAVLAVLRRTPAVVDVRGAICMANAAGLPLLGHPKIYGVMIDGPRHVARLAARPGGLKPPQVRQLARELAQALPPA